MAVRVGIDAAAFVDHQVLSPAARLDFSSHVQELLAQGRWDAARLWAFVAEVVDLGSHQSGSVLQVTDMPPLLQVPCLKGASLM